MQVAATWNNGKIELDQPLRLVRDHVRLIVTVPDDALITDPQTAPDLPNMPDDVIAAADALRQRLDAIRNAPLPPDDELPVESAKVQERTEAFALREDR